VLPSRRASDTRAGAPGSISGDLPAARRTVSLRPAALIRDGEVVVGLPPRRDSEVESRPNCRCHGDVPLSRLQIARRTTRQTTPRTLRSRPRSAARPPVNHPSPSMSSDRASPVVEQDERASLYSRRDRRMRAARRTPGLRFLRGSHGATVASLADPLNGRSPRHITLQCCDPVLPLQLERNRAQQAMNAWKPKGRSAVKAGKPAEPGARLARALS
jgi:hypothetical protein